MTSPLASLQQNVLLGPLTTIGIGGPARYFIDADSEESLAAALDFAAGHNLPVLVLGGGSNLLIADDGFPGLVLRIALRGVSLTFANGRAEVRSRAGEDWDHLVSICVASNLAGIECLSGIPGSVGGTPIQNVGAYGQEVSETIASVRAYDRAHGAAVEISARACTFAYRTSLFNTTARDRFIVLDVVYRLHPGASPALRYAELRSYFDDSMKVPSLQDVRNAVLAIRSRKGMVLDPNDPDSRSLGSFFKNPLLTSAEVARVRQRLHDLPAIPLADGMFKISAAWLIERAGFKRGELRGRVGLSTKHSLAIVNRGQATAREVLQFAGEIQGAVEQASGIILQMEPARVGFPNWV